MSDEISEAKQRLLDDLSNESESVLALAWMYARGYKLSGADVTKEWTNAIQNNTIIEQVYRRGYEDCLKDVENGQRRDFYHKAIYDVKKR